MYLEISGTNVRLLGSLHMVPVGEEQVALWACDAYAWCEELVVEHEPISFLPFFKGSQPLQDKLPAELFLALQNFWPSNGLLAPLHELRPWAALIGISILSQQVEEGIEPNFLRWAEEHKKPVQCLELPRDVAAAFDSVPIDDIQAAVRMTLRDRSSIQDRLIKMHSAWLKHDFESLIAMASGTPLFTMPSLRSVVLENRNQDWLPKIEAFIGTERRTLVVVGALHLCGSGGLLQLLDERGIQTTPIVQ